MIRLAFDARSAVKVLESGWFAGFRERLGGRAWEILHRLWISRRRLRSLCADEIGGLVGWPGRSEELIRVLVEFGVLGRYHGGWVMSRRVPVVPPAGSRSPEGGVTPTDLRLVYGMLSQRIRDLERRVGVEDDDGLERELRRLRHQRREVQERQLAVMMR